MRYLPNASQMREADLYTIEHVGIPSMVLMERAALETVRTMRDLKVDMTNALIVCGCGNNGGDGFAIGRILDENGLFPTIVLVGDETSLSVQAHEQLQILKRRGITVHHSIPNQDYTVVMDAIFGVGLSRNIEGHFRETIEKINSISGVKVAVDIPSGIDASSGKVLGIAFRADITVSYAFEKAGTVWYPGRQYAGDVYPVNIGITAAVFQELSMKTLYTYDKQDIQGSLPIRAANSHKGSYGKVLMITGSHGMSGAAYLSAKAAYTSGAGLVQIYTAEDNRVILQQMLPEAIITTYNAYDQKQLSLLLEWADVAAIGSGLGMSEISKQLVRQTILECKIPLVIDADGLNLLSSEIEILHDIQCPVVLTPHMKEMSRLLKTGVSDLQEERERLLKTFVEEYPVVCALKDARTLVMSRDENSFLNTSGNSSMAKAGSGDVLTGVITGMLAQGKKCYEGTVLGVYLHGLAGDDARDRRGAYSVLARDLIEGIRNCIED